MSRPRPLLGAGLIRAFARSWLATGFLFLYLPIGALVVYSFNESPLPSVWGGASLRWYRELVRDRELLAGLWLSLRIAFYAAWGSVVLGTLAAFTLVKYRRFVGRTLFSGMVNAPLVMPEVIIGLSLLLMLVTMQRWLGFPDRGLHLIFLDKGNIAALLPGARIGDMFESPIGASYGSIITKDVKFAEAMDIVSTLLDYGKKTGIKEFLLTSAPRVYERHPNENLDFAMLWTRIQLRSSLHIKCD